MVPSIFITPSINSLFLTGILILTILILLCSNFNKFIQLDYYQKIILLSAITTTIGIHGLIHLGVETKYNYNPYKWFFEFN